MKIVSIMLVAAFLAVPFALAAEQSVTGKVEQTEKGIIIAADDGDTYVVMGKDLSSMVGETVKAVGTVEEGDMGKTLTITSVEPAK
ncbi:MAG: hypothetical protein P8X55_20665 [Desulfosarcinaceae bacterium]